MKYYQTYNCVQIISWLSLSNTPTASLQRSKIPWTSVLDMTLNNLMVRLSNNDMTLNNLMVRLPNNDMTLNNLMVRLPNNDMTLNNQMVRLQWCKFGFINHQKRQVYFNTLFGDASVSLWSRKIFPCCRVAIRNKKQNSKRISYIYLLPFFNNSFAAVTDKEDVNKLNGIITKKAIKLLSPLYLK